MKQLTTQLTYLSIIATLILNSSNAFSHGENKPGPHGGYIRMPGVFHTEVVPDQKGFKIFLLDIQWQNPTIENSQVLVDVKNNNGAKTSLTCQKLKSYFYCETSILTSKDYQDGQIIIQATRNSSEGAPAVYDLPLSFHAKKSKKQSTDLNTNSQSEHHGHH